MAAENTASSQHALDLIFYDLPSAASIRLEFPIETGVVIPMPVAAPSVRLGASYGGGEMTIRSLSIQPRRIEFDIENAPATLPLLVHILSGNPFVYGWIQVPGNAQVSIATAAQRIRFVGAGYWAVPLIQSEADAKPVAKAVAPAPSPVPAPTPTPSSSKSNPGSKPSSTPATEPKSSTPTPAPDARPSAPAPAR